MNNIILITYIKYMYIDSRAYYYASIIRILILYIIAIAVHNRIIGSVMVLYRDSPGYCNIMTM